MFRKILGFSVLIGVFLLSSSIFAQNYIYRFELAKDYNTLFPGGSPAFNGDAPPTCTMQTNSPPFVLNCTKPMQSNDYVAFSAVAGQNTFLLTCFADQPNSGKPIQIPTACWCAPLLPNTSCPKY